MRSVMAGKVWDTMGTFKTAFILVAIVTVLLLVSIMLTVCYDEATKAGAGGNYIEETFCRPLLPLTLRVSVHSVIGHKHAYRFIQIRPNCC